MGGVADIVENPVVIPYSELNGFPVSTVHGHPGNLILGQLQGVPVACLQGRVHLYEGIDPMKVRVMIYTLRLLGCEVLFLTSAVGSLVPENGPGSLVCINDHINLQGRNPMVGPNDPIGPRFFSMVDAYDPKLRATLLECATADDIRLAEGTYLAVMGPSFETPAEIRAFKNMGADVVGMSCVAEVICARHCGMRCAAVAVVVNLASGMEEGAHITHDETILWSGRASAGMMKLLNSFIGRHESWSEEGKGMIFAEAIPEKLRPVVEQWVKWDKNEKTRQWVIDRAAAGDSGALQKLLGSRMAFGTAGLRAAMIAGSAGMNDLTVIQATQGLVQYIKKLHSSGKCEGAELSMVVGHDARHNSQRWAQIVACVCVHAGVHCHLYSEHTPTPMVPFAIQRLRAAAGVVVTASHNPPQDNGYKVYLHNAVQIIPPHDDGIAKEIEDNLEPWGDAVWAVETIRSSAAVSDPLGEMQAAYLAQSASLCAGTNVDSCPKIVYTPMHGVGRPMVEQVFAANGLPMPIVPEEQGMPDPDFSTVSFPNPEEAGALNVAMACADRHGAKLVFANDPDADRLCVAERQPDGAWRRLSGNELGALLGWWSFETRDKSKPVGDCLMLASTVSSGFLGKMAKVEGFVFEETLTGFKWMGSRAVEREKEGKTILFAFEEAIGYFIGSFGLRDKDGVSTAAVCAGMCCSVYSGGGTLVSQLQRLFEKYGCCVQNNGYYFRDTPAVTAAIFGRLRGWDPEECAQWGADRAPPAHLRYPQKAGRFVVENVRDVTSGFESSQPGGRPSLPVIADSEMVTFFFQNGAEVTLRTSGTEPKIKWYSEFVSDAADAATSAETVLAEVVAAVCDEWLQPKKNGLRPAVC